MQAWERDWLAYCRHVVRDDSHRVLCARLGGSPPAPGVAHDVRMPGYAGDLYEPGGLLWVNVVHRNLDQGGNAVAAEALIQATQAWRDERLDDAQYLEAQRGGYVSGLNAWTVGRAIKALCGRLEVDVRQIAYANAARCQVVPHTASHKWQDSLVALCQGWLPIDALVEALKPSLVVTTSALVCQLAPLAGNPLIVGRNLQNVAGLPLQNSPWRPPPNVAWQDALAAEWSQRRAN